jgi:hypothetical protein
MLLKCSFYFEYSEQLKCFVTVVHHRRYPYFDIVVGLVWSCDPESCASGSDAIGITSLARQVKGNDPD